MQKKLLSTFLLIVLTSCSAYIDSRVESSLLDALPKAVGPAASYAVTVAGSNTDANYFEKVRVQGSRVARANAPVIEQINLDLQGVSIDRQQKQLKTVREANSQVRVLPADLAGYLQQRGWLDDAVVRFAPPDRIVVTGTPKISGIAVPARGGVEFQGRLVPQGPQLQLTVDYLRLGGVEAPGLALKLVQSTVNPIVDLSAYRVPAQVDSVITDGSSLIVSASGSTLR